jgi:hypothetical protein
MAKVFKKSRVIFKQSYDSRSYAVDLSLFHAQLHYVINRVNQFMQNSIRFKLRLLPGADPNNLHLVIIFPPRLKREFIAHCDWHVPAKDSNDIGEFHLHALGLLQIFQLNRQLSDAVYRHFQLHIYLIEIGFDLTHIVPR